MKSVTFETTHVNKVLQYQKNICLNNWHFCFANTERYAIIREVRYVYITYYIRRASGFTMAKSTNVYDASSITVLEGLEAVRKKTWWYVHRQCIDQGSEPFNI